MKTRLFLAIVIGALTSFSLSGRGEEPTTSPANTSGETATNAPMFQNWRTQNGTRFYPIWATVRRRSAFCVSIQRRRPRVCSFARLKPFTFASIGTRRMKLTPSLSARSVSPATARGWSSGRSFNYMPAKMVHEAWLPANSLTFITVDGAWDVNWVEGPPTSADLSRAF